MQGGTEAGSLNDSMNRGGLYQAGVLHMLQVRPDIDFRTDSLSHTDCMG